MLRALRSARPLRGLIATIPFGDRQGTRGLVIGAPGSGKTVTLSAIGSAYVGAGYPVIAIDPKGDHEWRGALSATASSIGAPV